MHAMVLEGADHLHAGSVAHVGEPRVCVTAEVSLKDLPVLRPVENRAPLLEFVDPSR